MYVFDSSPLIEMFKHYYPERFPSLWERFDKLIKDESVSSVREVKNELTQSYGATDRLSKWATMNGEFFTQPSYDELQIVTDIFRDQHFQSLIRKQERLAGKPVADPFVLAKAKYYDYTVVTSEKWRKNSAKLPNACDKFNVPFMDLEKFMTTENWTF